MARTFRRLPPEPRPGSPAPAGVPTGGLLERLHERWDHRVTVVVGGPGHGKTTLLAAAMAAGAASRARSRHPEAVGDDVWLGLDPADADADRLARALADALADPGRRPETALMAGDVTPDPRTVADAVWQRAPRHVCLVLDDAHVLPPGSAGERWLLDLVASLPANGHVLLATAAEPPAGLPVALRVDVPGPPAGAPEVDPTITADPVVRVLAELGGADVDLLLAALGPTTDAGAVDPDRLRAVPGVAGDAEGWFVAHELLTAAVEPPDDRAGVRARAVDHLVGRGRYDDAFLLAAGADRWDLVPWILRAACLVAETLPANQLGRWLAASPPEVHATPAGRLATGLHRTYAAPLDAIEPLHEAAEGFRAAGDPDAELVAIAHIGRLAWWWQDAELLRRQTARVFELAQEGHPRAGAMAAFAWALVADMGGDDEAVLAHLGRIPPGVLDPGWELLARWYEGLVRLYLGQPAATRIIVDSLATADPSMGYVVETLELMTLWATGHVDAVMERLPAVVAAARAYGVTYSLAQGLTTATLAYAHTGDPDTARRCLADALAAAPPTSPGPGSGPEDEDEDEKTSDAEPGEPGDSGEPGEPGEPRRSVHAALATASLRLADGDEPAAVATLARAVTDHGVDRGPERRWWRQSLGLSYVLSPEARVVWDGRELRGHLATARTLARAVVDLRATGDPSALRRLDLPHLGVARSALHHRFAAELAVGLAARGEPDGRLLLASLGPPGRAAVRRIAADLDAGWGPEIVRAARDLLAAVPAPPVGTVHLALLGPLEIHRGDGDADEAPERLAHPGARALLAFLAAHRRTSRAAATGAVGTGAGFAEAVRHLTAALEPARPEGGPGYLLRLEGDGVELVTGDHLRLDVDDFDAHVAAAARAESHGAPGVALNHHRAVAALYRGELHADQPPVDEAPAPGPWWQRERDRYRARFVASAVRAAELLAARAAPGDAAEAEALARRALDADRSCRPARAVLSSLGATP
ncbi:MAG TPA: hypothetical protein VIL36_14795 [Acidimicrobiales bacterium]